MTLDIVEIICIVAGPLIAGLVQLMKGWSFVTQYPKVVAAVLSVLVSVVGGLTYWGLDWQGIVACTIVPLSTAVLTYEVAKTHNTPPKVR